MKAIFYPLIADALRAAVIFGAYKSFLLPETGVHVSIWAIAAGLLILDVAKAKIDAGDLGVSIEQAVEIEANKIAFYLYTGALYGLLLLLRGWWSQ